MRGCCRCWGWRSRRTLRAGRGSEPLISAAVSAHCWQVCAPRAAAENALVPCCSTRSRLSNHSRQQTATAEQEQRAPVPCSSARNSPTGSAREPKCSAMMVLQGGGVRQAGWFGDNFKPGRPKCSVMMVLRGGGCGRQAAQQRVANSEVRRHEAALACCFGSNTSYQRETTKQRHHELDTMQWHREQRT